MISSRILKKVLGQRLKRLRSNRERHMYIEVDNKKTYVATGSKDHVDGNLGMTFVHGTGMDHTVWTLAGRHFARKGLNIHAVDLPGHGRSEGAVVDSIEGMAD